MKPIGETIKQARKEAGYTIKELAEKADVSSSFFSRIESGKQANAHEATIIRISKYLPLDLMEIYGLTEQDKEIGKVIRRERLKLKITKSELAEISRVPWDTIHDIETGERTEINEETIIKISKYLPLDLMEIYGLTEQDKEIGKIIKRERLKLKITKTELAKKCKISWNTLHQIEEGRTQPYEKVRKRMAKYLNISLNQIFNLPSEDNKLSYTLKKSRLKKDISLEELSHMSGVSKVSLYYIEKGYSKYIYQKTINKISKCIQCDIEEFKDSIIPSSQNQIEKAINSPICSLEFRKYLEGIDTHQDIQKIIKDIREYLGITKMMLASKVGIIESKLNAIEKGELKPHLITIIRILKALDEYYIFLVVKNNRIRVLKDIISDAISKNNISIKEFSNNSNISADTIYSILKGKTTYKKETIEKLEKYLDIDLSIFIV